MKKMKNMGFTLVEMLVVITIIAFMGLMLIPAIVGLFNSGLDSQSYAMVTAELSAARTLAIKSSSYVCVHIQQADPSITGSNAGKFYMAVLVRSPLPTDLLPPNNISYFYQDQVFAIGTLTAGGTNLLTANPPAGITWVANQWSGYWIRILTSSNGAAGQTAQICVPSGGNNQATALPLTGNLNVAPASGDTYMIYKPSNIDPQVLPGTIAFGRLCSPFVVNGAMVQSALGDTAANDSGGNPTAVNVKTGQSFVTVNIVFSPAGTVVTSTPDSNGAVNFATLIPGTANYLPGYFYDDPNAAAAGTRTKLWPMPNATLAINANDAVNLPQPGTTALTMVDFTKYSAYNQSHKSSYLQTDNGGCPYLSINVNTGQMLPRK